jgi:hypothetical protein
VRGSVDIIDGMGEDGEMTVEIEDVAVALLEGQFGSDGGAAERKDGKLNLRHGASMKTIAEITSLGSFRFLAPVC